MGCSSKNSCHFKTSVPHQLCSLYIKLLEVNPGCDNLHPGTAGMFPPHFLQDCYSLFASNIAQADPQIDWYNTPFFLFLLGWCQSHYNYPLIYSEKWYYLLQNSFWMELSAIMVRCVSFLFCYYHHQSDYIPAPSDKLLFESRWKLMPCNSWWFPSATMIYTGESVLELFSFYCMCVLQATHFNF